MVDGLSTPEEILTAYKRHNKLNLQDAPQGPGSGFDADTVDALHAQQIIDKAQRTFPREGGGGLSIPGWTGVDIADHAFEKPYDVLIRPKDKVTNVAASTYEAIYGKRGNQAGKIAATNTTPDIGKLINDMFDAGHRNICLIGQGLPTLAENAYKISTPIDLAKTLGQPWAIQGEGRALTAIRRQNNMDNSIFKMDSASVSLGIHAIKGLYLQGNYANNTSGSAIEIKQAASVFDGTIDDVFIDEFDEYGIYYYASWNLSIKRAIIEHCLSYGAYLLAAVDLKVEDSSFKYNAGGIEVFGEAVSFNDIYFYENTGLATFIATGGPTNIVTFNQCHWRGVAGASNLFKSQTGYIKINNSSFMHPDATTYRINDIGANSLEVCNTTFDSKAYAASLTGYRDEKIKFRHCKGLTPYGLMATPIGTAYGTIGWMGNTAVPVASTDYKVFAMPILITVTGGTGVDITIKDEAGTTVFSGLASIASPTYLPAGYKINFGAFSVAPTLTVCGVD